MGSCLSKKKRDKATARASAREAHPEPEEETVKEVLSETPKPRLSIVGEEDRKHVVGVALPNGSYEERSEDASEIGSQNESFSTAPTEKKVATEEYAYGEVKRRREERSPAKLHRKRSFSGELSCKRDRCAAFAGGGGGSARSSPSPARRRDGGVGRTLSAREARNRVGGGYGLCRDPGPWEMSGPRSVSPAAKRVAEQQRLGIGGGRQCRDLSTGRVNGRASPRRVAEYEVRREDGAGRGDVVGGYKESLENPLVSMECFIFL